MRMKDRIRQLKAEKGAIILAHFYQEPDVQDVADFIGDSLDLSRKASETDAQIIVFCGVNFMAETAKILSPEKKVLLPVYNSSCPMAMMINKRRLLDYKAKNPDRKIICYVNSYAEVKALSDVCVTSSNAEKIITHFQHEKMLYIPDKNLGMYLKDRYDLDIDIWPGYCRVHNNLKVEDVVIARNKHPHAQVLIHPEAPLDVLKQADYVGSTRGILNYAQQSSHQAFVIGTESGMLYPLQKACPGKSFHILKEPMSCVNMKKTRLTDVLRALEEEQYEIHVEEGIRKQAKKALDLMLELS